MPLKREIRYIESIIGDLPGAEFEFEIANMNRRYKMSCSFRKSKLSSFFDNYL
jgi:hypothetical protein